MTKSLDCLWMLQESGKTPQGRPSLGMGIMGYQWLTSESNGAPMENHGKPANYHWKSLIARLYLRRWVRSQGRAILRLMVIDVDSPEAIWEGITFPHLFYLSFGKNFRQPLLPFCKCFAHPFGLCIHRGLYLWILQCELRLFSLVCLKMINPKTKRTGPHLQRHGRVALDELGSARLPLPGGFGDGIDVFWGKKCILCSKTWIEWILMDFTCPMDA